MRRVRGALLSLEALDGRRSNHELSCVCKKALLASCGGVSKGRDREGSK